MSLAETAAPPQLGLPSFANVVSLDRRRLDHYWELLRDNKTTFMEGAVTREQFERHMFGDSVLLEIPGCLILLESIIPGCRLEVHLAVYDKKLSDKTEMLKELLVWAFLHFNLHRIETFLAQDYHTIRRFIEEKLGFKFEGILRCRGLRRDRPIDVKVYSILRNEVI